MHYNYHALLHDELAKNILRIDTSEHILYLIVRYWNQGTSRSSLAPPGPQNLQAHPFFMKHKQLFSSASMQFLLPALGIDFCSLTCSFSSLINFNWFLQILRLQS